MNRAEIEAAIPHREPFLFLDRIVERSAEGLVSSWQVPQDASWFAGHFPDEPVTPGVILSEHVFQSAAVFVSLELGGFSEDDGVPVLTKIEGARFKRIVRPGDAIATTVRLTERLGPAWYFSGKITSAGETVANIRFVLSATGAMRRVLDDAAGETR